MGGVTRIHSHVHDETFRAWTNADRKIL